jgi:putative endonuclease
MSRRRSQLGRLGEDAACEFLQRKGYALLERRWRSRTGEIDLVMRQGDTLVLVEVRTRRAPVEQAAASVGPRKRQRLLALAEEYLSGLDAPGNARIDVVCVGWNARGILQIEHLEGAVEADLSP